MKRNYKETIEWLFLNLPMFQKIGISAYKKDLKNIVALTTCLNNPQDNYDTIHIAGTNGKGSTSHMLASVLQEAGYKVGLLTSPHLKDFRERIRVNGEMCSEQYVIDFIDRYENFILEQKASFFEITTAMGFDYFKKEKVDVAIIETGLGGRLDSTNIVNPILSIITNIALEHTHILGHTLTEIASAKGGIIKESTPVIIGETTRETKQVFINIAKERNAAIYFAEDYTFQDFPSDLLGNYQVKNKRTVIFAIQKLREDGYVVSEKNISAGLLNVIKNTGLRGRWDELGQLPTIIADTAHNPHGLAEVSKQIKKQKYGQLHLVLGFVNDKDVKKSLSFFPKDAHYYFCEPDISRKYPLEDLKKVIPADLANINFFKSVSEAINEAKLRANKTDFIYIGGSTFVVAEAI